MPVVCHFRTRQNQRINPMQGNPSASPELVDQGRRDFGASSMLAISKAAMLQSNIARPILASTDCRHWRLI
jgi:hypothetical protein